MGTCDLALTNASQSLREFELARDDDALAFRADSRINQIIRDAADEEAGKGVSLLDAARMLAQDSPEKIPGNELFYEHVHLNFDGNYLLGLAFAEQTAKLLPKSIAARVKMIGRRRTSATPGWQFPLGTVPAFGRRISAGFPSRPLPTN